MAERGILFSAPMIRALLDGRKTQTRRLAFVRPRQWSNPHRYGHETGEQRKSPWCKRQPGDRLYVRESLRLNESDELMYSADGQRVHFESIPEDFRPSMRGIPNFYMPRWAARLALIVTEKRRERLQDISAEDCIAEGCEIEGMSQNRETGEWEPADDYWLPFADMWDSIHGSGAWDGNPEVVALTFTVQRAAPERADG